MSVFGKAKFGGNKRNWFKLKDGEGHYRILPPMGDNAEEGRWSKFYSIHYGYKNSAGEMRTFESPRLVNRKTKMVEVEDAAYDRIQQLTAKLNEAKKAGNTALAEQIMKLVGGKKSRYNLDNNHYMNVVDLQGNVGILKIRHRAKLALDALIKKLRDGGVDPLDPETGRYFTFSRSGTAMDTTYQVTVYKRKLMVAGVGEVEQDVVHAIDEDLARRCLVENKDGSYTYKEAANLSSLFKKPTAEEVARIVNEGEKAVDEIFDTKARAVTTAEEFATDDGGLEGEEELAAPTAAVLNPPPVNTAPAPVQVTATVMTPEVTTVQHQSPQATVTVTPVATSVGTAPLAAVTGLSTASKDAAPVATKATPPKTTAQAVAEQSDEEFLKSLGL